MAERKKSGCLGAIIAIIIIGGLVFVGLIAAIYKSKERSVVLAEETARARAAAVTTLAFKEDELPRFPFPKVGEPISREQFVAHMIDDHATDLAKDSFREVASQATVTWKLRTHDIQERDGHITGEFDLPWEIRHHRSTRSSSVRVYCHFTEESRQGLLDLRRDDWVTITGNLSFDGNTPSIKDARLQSNALPAEKP